MNYYALERIQDVCEALVACFNAAATKSNGLCLGLSDSFEILDYDPQSILVCVIPYVKEQNDPLKHVHLLLIEAFCKENGIRLLKMISMEGFCSLLKVIQRMDRSNPYSLDISNTDIDATDLLIIKNDVNDFKQDDHFRSCHDALVNIGNSNAAEVDETIVTYGSAHRSSVPVLPALFPTFFNTTL